MSEGAADNLSPRQDAGVMSCGEGAPDGTGVAEEACDKTATCVQTTSSVRNDYCPSCLWTESDLPTASPLEKDISRDMNAVMTDKTETRTDLLNSSLIPHIANAIMTQTSFLQSQTPQTVPGNNTPKIVIKLMRPRSSSAGNILHSESCSDNMDTLAPVRRMSLVADAADKYLPEITRKRGGYFQRVRRMFKPGSSSLSNLSNDLTRVSPPNKESRTQGSNLKKIKSQTVVSDDEASSDTLPGLVNDQTHAGQSTTRDQVKGMRPAEGAKNSLECDTDNDVVDDSGTETMVLKVHRPERSYSLIRRESEENDPAHVHFTRIPSLRRRRVYLSLEYHFKTSLPLEEAGESHVIKEATNIQPLDNGATIVTDILSSHMVLFDRQGYPKVTFAMESGCEPWATCLTPDGGLAVTLRRQGCVSLWSTSGEPISEFGHNILSGPAGIQCDRLGRLVVVDEQLHSVFIFSAQGEQIANLQVPNRTPNLPASIPYRNRKAKSPTSRRTPCFDHPRYVCVTNSGNYVIADSANHCIKIFDLDMNFQDSFGEYGRGDGHFRFPYGIASDDVSNLYVADHFNNRISLFSPDGKFVEHILTVQDGIVRPKSIAIRHPFLYVSYGYLRSDKISTFKLRRDKNSQTSVG